MLHHQTADHRHLNLSIVSLGAGLALAAAVVLTAGGLTSRQGGTGSAVTSQPAMAVSAQGGVDTPANPQFANMADAAEALFYLEVIDVAQVPVLSDPDSYEAHLGLGRRGDGVIALFPSMTDAWEASVR